MPYKDPTKRNQSSFQRRQALQPGDAADMARELARLRAEAAQREAEDAKREGLRRVVREVEVPTWLAAPQAPKAGPGVPTLLLSDWHMGEVIRPELVAGYNRFDKATLEARVRQLVKGVVDLTMSHMVRPEYPGMVVPVNGDMVSGSIHEELTVTNWGDIRDVLKHGAGLIIWLLETLSSELDAPLFVPWTTGNHGRMTKKMEHKRRVGTSFDAILGDMVAEHFANRRGVEFAIAEGTSVLYRVYGHRYLLTHGDPASTGAKGGDGIIGALGPIVRGLKKLAARAGQLGQDFDTLLLGHFHQRVITNRIIVNGTLKGFDEYAMGEGFEPEPPSQNLWFTHPERGVTAYWPVYVEPKGRKFTGQWVGLYKE